MLIVNGIFSLNILLGCVSYRQLRFIVLKLKIKLAEAIIKDVISNILYKVKLGVFSAKYKELIFKKV